MRAISALFREHSRPVLIELHITQVATYLRQVLLNCGAHLKIQRLHTQGTHFFQLPSTIRNIAFLATAPASIKALTLPQCKYCCQYKHFTTGVVAEEWKVFAIISIFRKEDTSVCRNYLSIALVSLATKLYNRILL